MYEVKIELSKLAWNAFHKAAKSQAQISEDKIPEKPVVFFTHEDFNVTTKHGKASVGKYMEAMCRDFSTLFYPLVSQDGFVEFKNSAGQAKKILWQELVARAPGYFVNTYGTKQAKKALGTSSFPDLSVQLLIFFLLWPLCVFKIIFTAVNSIGTKETNSGLDRQSSLT